MKEIPIDIDVITELGITPDDFVLLYIKHFDIRLDKKIKVRPRPKTLQSLGLCKITPQGVVVRQKFIDLVDTDFDRMFAELCATYPAKVGRPGDYRILHATDPKAKANDTARRRYKKVIGSKPMIHRRIINALNTQLKLQRNKLQFMQQLEVWINARTWEKWEGLDAEKQEKSDGRITRELD